MRVINDGDDKYDDGSISTSVTCIHWYIYMCIYIHTWKYICTCIHIHAFLNKHIYIHISTLIDESNDGDDKYNDGSISTSVTSSIVAVDGKEKRYLYIYLYEYLYVCISLYVYLYVCLYMYIYVYVWRPV
jgi:hypothetical protein